MPESLKNTILVMANQGFLVPPAENASHARLWTETWKRLDKFLPGMFEELFPEAAKKQEGKQAGSISTAASKAASIEKPAATATVETSNSEEAAKA